MKFVFRTIGIMLSFALFSYLIVFIGDTESPAFKSLRELQNPALDLAIIGDSRPHAGISPTTLEFVFIKSKKLSINTHNFSVDGTDVLHHFSFATNGLLKLKNIPKLIIWGVNPMQFNDVRTSNRLEQLRFNDVYSFAKAGASLELLLDIATMHFFAPWQHRPLVAKMISDYSERAGLRTLPLQKKILKLTVENEPLSRKYIPLPDGQEPFEVLEWKDRFDRGAKAYLADYSKLNLSEWHFELTKILIQKINKAGSKLIILELPVAPWYQKNLSSNPKHIAWRNRLQALATNNGAFFWNHSDILNLKDEDFGDPGHMSRQTADKYSEQLARRLVNLNLISEKLILSEKSNAF